MGGASLVKELLLGPGFPQHIEFDVEGLVWEGIEAVQIVVVEH
jgi:hypothetical protein